MATPHPIAAFARKLGQSRSLRPGRVTMRLTGRGGGDFHIACSSTGAQLVKAQPDGRVLMEVTGSAAQIRAILAGKKNARKQFLAGGFRLRGDPRFISDVAVELGLLNEPL